MSNYIPYETIDVIMYPCPTFIKVVVVKGAQDMLQCNYLMNENSWSWILSVVEAVFVGSSRKEKAVFT